MGFDVSRCWKSISFFMRFSFGFFFSSIVVVRSVAVEWIRMRPLIRDGPDKRRSWFDWSFKWR